MQAFQESPYTLMNTSGALNVIIEKGIKAITRLVITDKVTLCSNKHNVKQVCSEVRIKYVASVVISHKSGNATYLLVVVHQRGDPYIMLRTNCAKATTV